MRFVAMFIYCALQIVFIPLAIVGIVLTGYRQIAVSKRLGVSQTAIEIINGRWTMHIFGIRDDPATASLMSVLPNTSVIGLWLVLFPLWLQTRMSGQLSFYPRVPSEGDERIADLVPARTLYFDRIIERVLPDVEQFVSMGASYDTRAYGVFADAGVSVFELDQPVVQAHKLAMLARTGINTENVTFISSDFTEDDMFARLSSAGFDKTKRTLFFWEGVTLYLTPGEVRQTMQLISRTAAPGTILLADIYAERTIELLGKSNAVGKVLELTDEGLGFGLPLESDWEQVLNDFVEAQSLNVGESHFLGSNDKKGPYAVVTEMRC